MRGWYAVCVDTEAVCMVCNPILPTLLGVGMMGPSFSTPASPHPMFRPGTAWLQLEAQYHEVPTVNGFSFFPQLFVCGAELRCRQGTKELLAIVTVNLESEWEGALEHNDLEGRRPPHHLSPLDTSARKAPPSRLVVASLRAGRGAKSSQLRLGRMARKFQAASSICIQDPKSVDLSSFSVRFHGLAPSTAAWEGPFFFFFFFFLFSALSMKPSPR
ncbi:hypothetical protein B0T26DRAFT_104973 [Lasiosphaeria miniovina]|uniref:Uncharacterized protein n=1 Tax=Lasiosphaeria miniovina TaxID=1954250 RepID=A0AA40E6H0_9PEZI|nr:uncharacterized protein B0T26DRAFT_104973 [Lasiosphaeria miniovina]KAK0726832.1 hypothetical protein B0T26DRAFT_104973 [Lasiosphaeria miniovina]